MMESCGDCLFVRVIDSDSRCCRSPPSTPSGGVYATFPLVRSNDWCGEYQPAPAPPVATDAPVIVDVPYASQEGAVLTCTMGNWDNEPTSYAYQWILDGSEILATGPTYDVPNDPNVIGHDATCIVTASNAAGDTDSPPSNMVVIAAPPAASRRR